MDQFNNKPNNTPVPLARIQPISAGKLLGRTDASSGVPQEITVGSGLTLSGTTLTSTGGSPYTDENAQDAVGSILSSEFTYNDAANSIQINAISNSKITGLGSLATQSGTFSGTSSGTNTGDQNLFSTIAVSGQSHVVADTTSDTLTLVAGTNITITTDAATDTITISSSGTNSFNYGLTHIISRGLF